jgi:hypothetical protein
MADNQISDDELQLYYSYLMKNNGVLNVHDFNDQLLDEDYAPYSAEELALEVV